MSSGYDMIAPDVGQRKAKKQVGYRGRRVERLAKDTSLQLHQAPQNTSEHS